MGVEGFLVTLVGEPPQKLPIARFSVGAADFSEITQNGRELSGGHVRGSPSLRVRPTHLLPAGEWILSLFLRTSGIRADDRSADKGRFTSFLVGYFTQPATQNPNAAPQFLGRLILSPALQVTED
jgi:hypothetical protein